MTCARNCSPVMLARVCGGVTNIRSAMEIFIRRMGWGRWRTTWAFSAATGSGIS